MIYDEIIDIQEAKYDRSAILRIRDGKLVYDNSDLEYGEIEVNLEIVEKAIKEYRNKERNNVKEYSENTICTGSTDFTPRIIKSTNKH